MGEEIVTKDDAGTKGGVGQDLWVQLRGDGKGGLPATGHATMAPCMRSLLYFDETHSIQ